MIAERQKNNNETYGLISLERAEKFDLLVQLISNQREALVFCGAKGIGKTFLLKKLKQNKEDLWTICFLQGIESLTLEVVQEKLAEAIKNYGQIPEAENLDDMLHFYEEHHQKVVLILENSENLIAGMMDKLINYGVDYPAIKIIFTLTKEDLTLKNKTDEAIDNCYFLELPALDKEHLNVFLQLLSTLPEGLITEDEIDARLLKNLYHRSAGNPQLIIEELQLLQQRQDNKWQKVLLLASCVIAVSSIAYLYQSILKPKESEKLKPKIYQVTQSSQQKIKTDNQVIKSAETDLAEKNKLKAQALLNQQQAIDTSIKQKELEIQQKIKAEKEVQAALDAKKLIEKQQKIKKEKEKEKKRLALLAKKEREKKEKLKAEAKKKQLALVAQKKERERLQQIEEEKKKKQRALIAEQKFEKQQKAKHLAQAKISDDKQWVLQQSARKYFLQLIVLSNKRALKNMLARHSSLQNSLKYIHLKRGNKSQYILIYGSFANANVAKKAIETLPEEFSQAWPKRFNAIQKEINSTP